MRTIIKKIKEKVVSLKKEGFFFIIIGNTLTKMLAFISSIVIVRLVSKNDYACLSYADNIYLYISLISGLGMFSAVLKYCVSEDKKKNKAYFVFALKYGTFFQIFLCVILFFCTYIIKLPFSGAAYIIRILSLFPILNYIFMVVQSYLRARFNNKLFAMSGIIQAVSVLVFSVGLVYIMGMNGIIVARYIALAISMIICVKFIKKDFDGIETARLNKIEIKGFLALSISMLLATLFSTVIPVNENFIVNNVIQSSNISANYKVANLIPSQLIFVTNSIMIFFFPIIAKIKHLKDVWKLSRKIGVCTFILIGILCIIGMIFTPFIVKTVYGDSYSDAIWLSNAFWWVYFFNAGFRVVPMTILPAIGFGTFNAIVSVITCLVHFSIDYISISTFGLSGAIYTTGIVYFLSGFVYWIYLYKKCKDR
ncbi:oligosaccharide flippase family protein [Eubacterium callanderi]|uniref:oligosaccharide flippase family protein n=1 Tax=Eubacterium callanderi TaxID=53442 RepID=UPI0029FEE4A7|nr:oligosaccharide flippase family protein [Eubacterium callanderi]